MCVLELARLGKYCRVMGQYTEAEEHLKEALTVRKSCLPTADPLIAQCKTGNVVLLGVCFIDCLTMKVSGCSANCTMTGRSTNWQRKY